MEVLGLGGTRVKIEADSDASFFGSNSCQFLGGAADMDYKDHLDDNFFPSDITDLDFEILQDLTLPNEFNILEGISLPEDCHSNSNSFTSEMFLDPCSSSSPFSDSPPLTPPSVTDSDGGSGSSPSPHSQADVKLRREPNNNLLLAQIGKGNIPMPKSSRGRSASHDSPDVQALKRHIRMIRNRESACLSRKKKKDHVTNLETRVAELERENALLKQENLLLKSRLSGQQINQIPASFTSKMYANNDVNKAKGHVPKTSAVVKIALLGLCCFLFVSLSPNQSATNPSIPHNSNQTSKIMTNLDLPPNAFVNLQRDHSSDGQPHPNLLRSRRSVGLWETDNSIEHDTNVNSNNSHAYAKENMQNSTERMNDTKKDSKATSQNPRSFRNLNFTNSPPENKCPTYFNQTEALRVQNDLKGIFGRRMTKKKVPTKPLVYSLIDLEMRNIENKGLTVYNENMRRFSNVLDQLQQREDTFYVVSLAFDNQLLLSAKAHNATSRPKMSFVMPWKNDTLGGKEEIMQIDCEVTRVLNLNNKNGKNRRKH